MSPCQSPSRRPLRVRSFTAACPFCPDGTGNGPFSANGNFGVPSSFHENFCVLTVR